MTNTRLAHTIGSTTVICDDCGWTKFIPWKSPTDADADRVLRIRRAHRCETVDNGQQAQ